MKRLLSLFLLIGLFFACGGPSPPQVKISLPANLYSAVSEILQQERYAVYVRDYDVPVDWQDCLGRMSLICGDFSLKGIVALLNAGVEQTGEPLFSSVRQYGINSNLVSGRINVSQDLTLNGGEGKSYTIKRDLERVGRDIPADSLLSICLDSLGQEETALILLPTSIKRIPAKLVRINFSKELTSE